MRSHLPEMPVGNLTVIMKVEHFILTSLMRQHPERIMCSRDSR